MSTTTNIQIILLEPEKLFRTISIRATIGNITVDATSSNNKICQGPIAEYEIIKQ